MNVRYRMFDPTGNLTLLVETPVDAAYQAETAARLLEAEPAAEQVGFLCAAPDADIALRMAGGEFCGNAAMCAAVCAAERGSTDAGAFRVRVSGAEKPVGASVARGADGSWRGTVDMPRPRAIDRVLLPGAGTVRVVRFDGISHVLPETPMPRPLAEQSARSWCGQLGADALGVLFVDPQTERMAPLVYVPGVDTLCWESACASGTAAVGAALFAERGERVRVTLHQPGGSLTIEADADALRLTGTVRPGGPKEIEI